MSAAMTRSAGYLPAYDGQPRSIDIPRAIAVLGTAAVAAYVVAQFCPHPYAVALGAIVGGCVGGMGVGLVRTVRLRPDGEVIIVFG